MKVMGKVAEKGEPCGLWASCLILQFVLQDESGLSSFLAILSSTKAVHFFHS